MKQLKFSVTPWSELIEGGYFSATVTPNIRTIKLQQPVFAPNGASDTDRQKYIRYAKRDFAKALRALRVELNSTNLEE